ncbi:MAG: hypothetical protein V4773_24200 [Verrucomicrobiota bacterium]
MKRLPRIWLLVVSLAAALPLPAREEILPLTESRTISITVPDGFSYKAGVNSKGGLGATLIDEKARVSLQVSFDADGEGEFEDARARRERLFEEFKNYVEGSTQKGMQFVELAPKVGKGTICVFTDEKLLGKPVSEYPEGEYLHLTIGVKSWPGVVATFTLFSNDLKSPQHEAVMKVLRESLHEKPVPLL